MIIFKQNANKLGWSLSSIKTGPVYYTDSHGIHLYQRFIGTPSIDWIEMMLRNIEHHSIIIGTEE